MRDEERREITGTLVLDSDKHGRHHSRYKTGSRCKPDRMLEPPPDINDIATLLNEQLEKEKFALAAHKQCIGLANNLFQKSQLASITKDEQRHIMPVENTFQT